MYQLIKCFSRGVQNRVRPDRTRSKLKVRSGYSNVFIRIGKSQKSRSDRVMRVDPTPTGAHPYVSDPFYDLYSSLISDHTLDNTGYMGKPTQLLHSLPQWIYLN